MTRAAGPSWAGLLSTAGTPPVRLVATDLDWSVGRGPEVRGSGEALLLASKAGVDAEKVRQALMGGFASSRILEVHGERMTKRTFNPGFRIELHQKDLNLALSTAQAIGVSLPNTATCHDEHDVLPPFAVD